MPHYRVFTLGLDNRVTDALVIECETDQAALDEGRKRLGKASAGEVWQGNRKVGNITSEMEPSIDPPQPGR